MLSECVLDIYVLLFLFLFSLFLVFLFFWLTTMAYLLSHPYEIHVKNHTTNEYYFKTIRKCLNY